MKITLSANELIDLMMEKEVSKEGMQIKCKDSFLTVIALLTDKSSKLITN